jgi:effector-binding domain-containing protein
VASRLPGGRVAHATHRGPYGRLGDTHKAIIDYCDQQGLKRTGQRWEIYGHHRDDRAELETEVVWQLA